MQARNLIYGKFILLLKNIFFNERIEWKYAKVLTRMVWYVTE